jgi:hypothetical protein
MRHHRGLEGGTGGNQAVGAFEIDAITEGHAIQRVHFAGRKRAVGQLKMLRPFTKLVGLAAYCQSGFCET